MQSRRHLMPKMCYPGLYAKIDAYKSTELHHQITTETTAHVGIMPGTRSTFTARTTHVCRVFRSKRSAWSIGWWATAPKQGFRTWQTLSDFQTLGPEQLQVIGATRGPQEAALVIPRQA